MKVRRHQGMEFTGGTTVTASMGILEQIHMISNLSRHGNSYDLFGYVGEKAHKIVPVSRNEVHWPDTGQRVLYFRTTPHYIETWKLVLSSLRKCRLRRKGALSTYRGIDSLTR